MENVFKTATMFHVDWLIDSDVENIFEHLQYSEQLLVYDLRCSKNTLVFITNVNRATVLQPNVFPNFPENDLHHSFFPIRNSRTKRPYLQLTNSQSSAIRK